MIGNSLQYFPVGRYEIRKFEGKKPVYKPVGEDATDALNALQKEKQLLGARHLFADVPTVQLVEEPGRATASIVVANQNGANQYAGLNPTWTNVAPRIGFAYTVTPGTVLRGGFGISYFPMNYTSNSSLKNQPFVSAFNCNNGNWPTPIPGIGGPGNGTGTFQRGLPLPTAASATNPAGNIADPVDPASVPPISSNSTSHWKGPLVPKCCRPPMWACWAVHIAQIYNDQNLPPLISNSALNAIAAQKGLSAGNAYNTLRPFYKQLPNITQIGGYNSGGSSNYNALQLSLNRRTSAGLTSALVNDKDVKLRVAFAADIAAYCFWESLGAATSWNGEWLRATGCCDWEPVRFFDSLLGLFLCSSLRPGLIDAAAIELATNMYSR